MVYLPQVYAEHPERVITCIECKKLISAHCTTVHNCLILA